MLIAASKFSKHTFCDESQSWTWWTNVILKIESKLCHKFEFVSKKSFLFQIVNFLIMQFANKFNNHLFIVKPKISWKFGNSWPWYFFHCNWINRMSFWGWLSKSKMQPWCVKCSWELKVFIVPETLCYWINSWAKKLLEVNQRILR